ncbi:MAG: Anaerobic glycerol-3-phosphate dehydrogenase subunit [Verrucomicrobiota bacterium]|jgi:FAD/FMN-containing dehydrogenase/Fe-S oxidoreductase
MKPAVTDAWQQDLGRFEGEFHTGQMLRRLYSTDASEFQEMPLAVALPKTEGDVLALVRLAARHRIGLIPRTAGTSLAGQVVGTGMVMDLGRHLNRILSIDAENRRVRVQPGVIRNELNMALAPHGLLFGPETSTANRAMMGGMVGNNSCGSNSIVYQSTRQHLVSTRGFLSDGSEVTFEPLTQAEFDAKCNGPDTLETRIYREVRDMLGNADNRRLIRKHFPKPTVTRRNTGYALDQLMDTRVFTRTSDKPFNLCQLIAGSEGTLFVGVEFEFNCEPLPPPGALMCAHFGSVIESLHANLIALQHQPSAAELIDKHILDCTKENIEQRKNRFFVEGDPGAILVIEIRRDTRKEIEKEMAALEANLRKAGHGYAYPVLWDDDVAKVWELRRAGQGVMTNVVGDTRPAEVVEDTAVDVQDLPAYIGEFDALMRDKYGISCVYYAHAGSGELHTRPLINLKTESGHKMFRSIAEDIAALVKKYRGSLSGEHGDGRLRGEFIRFMVGDECYGLMRRIKETFDPGNILNPGKIIDTPPMDAFHRYGPGHPTPDYETVFDFSNVMGVLRAAEKCNGSGDCRKTQLTGGTMCPSYMATREEKDSTRARANILRQILTHPPDPNRPFANDEIKEVMDLCLSCKGCKSECPSNVDIAKLKAEFLQHYYDAKGVPFRSQLIGHFASMAEAFSPVPWAWNMAVGTPWIRRLVNRAVGFHPDRTMPLLASQTLRSWFKNRPRVTTRRNGRKVLLFCDEFTNFNDAEIGIAAVELLEGLGYEVVLPLHEESGRASLSKGLLRRARKFARKNVMSLAPLVSADTPLVGIEPSAILCFRDEYPDLLRGAEQETARQLAPDCLMFDEFIAREMDAGRIDSKPFRKGGHTIHLHGHCQQKALASLTPTVRMLQLPEGNQVRLIPSGCCGMAGSFGYEQEHYELSQKVGELVLFPRVRKAAETDLIAAPGTSCRHQIHDGTGRIARHPIQILREALSAKR